jgi:hypothetical protein
MACRTWAAGAVRAVGLGGAGGQRPHAGQRHPELDRAISFIGTYTGSILPATDFRLNGQPCVSPV